MDRFEVSSTAAPRRAVAWTKARWTLVTLAIVTAVLVWLPALVFAVGLAIASFTGCPATEAGPQPCLVLGTDIGNELYSMVMMGWIVIAFLPFMGLTLVVGALWGSLRLVRAMRRVDRDVARGN